MGMKGADMNITDVRVRKVAKEGKMKAVVSITLDDEFVVHDIKVIEGEKGRIEARNVYFRDIHENGNTHDTDIITQQTLTLCRFGRGKAETVEIPRGEGSHGGADVGIFGKIFSVPPDPSIPTLEDGIQAVLTGTAMVESLKTGKTVKVQEQL